MKLAVTEKIKANWKVINKARRLKEYPALNFLLWVKTRNRIDVIPQSYDQDTFIDFVEKTQSPCGTVACLAGEAIICAAPNVKKGIRSLSRAEYPDQRAAKLLGLENYEEYIFEPAGSGWPDKYRIQFQKAKTNQGRARAAVHYLDSVIRTGEILDKTMC